VFQGRTVIYISGGFTLANTHPAFSSSSLPQDREKIEERKEDLWFIIVSAG